MFRQFLQIVLLTSAFLFADFLQAGQAASPFTSGFRYDLGGKLVGVISPDPDGPGPLKYPATRNTYDSNGLLLKVETGELSSWYDENVSPSDWSGFTSEVTKVYRYDHYGRKIVDAVLDKQGYALNLMQFSYTPLNQLECKNVRMDARRYHESSLTSLGSACSPTSTPAGYDRVTRYTYDYTDRLLRETRAHLVPGVEQQYVTNKYLPESRLLDTQIDAAGNVTKYEYDSYKRLKRRYYPSPSKVASQSFGNPGTHNPNDFVELSYDANGNLMSERKRNGAVVNFRYDNNNRMIIKDYINNTKQRDIYYDYDLRGLQLSARFDSAVGPGITNSYDSFGNVRAHSNNMSANTQNVSFGYDANGNRTNVNFVTGIAVENYAPIRRQGTALVSYEFDGLNRMTSIATNISGAVVSKKIEIAYGANGKRSVVKGSAGGTTYTFNGPQLTSFYTSVGGDPSNRLKVDFAYNAAQQIVTLTRSNSKYYYNGNVNRAGKYVSDGLNRYQSIAGQPMGYDANSNLTNDGTYVYTYDDENRLLTASNGLVSANFVYDPNGRLFRSTINGNVTEFQYAGDALIAEYDGTGAVKKRYVHGDQVDEPMIQYSGTNFGVFDHYYLHKDHQGSIIAESDYSGSLRTIFAYDAYGIPASLNIAASRFGYTGQQYFPEIGLNYYKARWYSPKLGRFLQTDPIGYADDMNMYAYVGNDPVNYNDPTGESRIRGTFDSGHVDVALDVLVDEAVEQVANKTEAGSVANSAARHLQRSNETLRQSRASTLARNVATGKKGESMTAARLGDKVAGKQVTFKTSDGTRTRQDFVTKDKGTVETKTGNSPLSPGQQKFKDDVDAGREVTPVGANAEKAGLIPNQPTTMTSCTVDRPC